MPPSFKGDLKKWVDSVIDELKRGEAAQAAPDVTFAFFRQPLSHRVIATSSDVIEKTGKYYVRIFGGDSFARESDGAELFCCVTAKDIVPNYNLFNVRYESRTYAASDLQD